MKGDLFAAWCASGDGSTLEEYLAHRRGRERELRGLRRQYAQQSDLAKRQARLMQNMPQGFYIDASDEYLREITPHLGQPIRVTRPGLSRLLNDGLGNLLGGTLGAGTLHL